MSLVDQLVAIIRIRYLGIGLRASTVGDLLHVKPLGERHAAIRVRVCLVSPVVAPRSFLVLRQRVRNRFPFGDAVRKVTVCLLAGKLNAAPSKGVVSYLTINVRAVALFPMARPTEVVRAVYSSSTDR